MSFTSLTSHVILLMLVSWMGAELLASGNRMIRRVFGKLSVLLGMYALTFLVCKPGISMPGLHALFFVDYSRYMVSY